jgi:hypothetical protein
MGYELGQWVFNTTVTIIHSKFYLFTKPEYLDWFMVFNSTFNNISAISWQKLLTYHKLL